MYYLANRLERAFIKKELMLVPEDTELPPDFVLNWLNFLQVKWSSQQK